MKYFKHAKHGKKLWIQLQKNHKQATGLSFFFNF